MAAYPDTRFALIEDAAALIAMLPAPEKITWPEDPGDIEAIETAIAQISVWLPKVKASRRAHRRELRERAQARRAAAQRIVAAGVPAAMGNGTRP